MKVARDMSITEKDLVYRRRRGVRPEWKDPEEVYWEKEQNHPNYMEFPDDGPKGWPLVGQTSNPYEVDMSDAENL
jgi:hypothetical protein